MNSLAPLILRKMNRVITDTCLFIDSEGRLFRKKCPFVVRLKTNKVIDTIAIVNRILVDDENMILFEIDQKVWSHLDCVIVEENRNVYLNQEIRIIVPY